MGNLIDVDSVIKSKNGKLYKFLPGFLLRWIKRIIHQDDINRIISENKDVYGVDFVKAVLDDIGAVVTVKGLENIPAVGKFVVVSNHPLGGLDGMALMYAVSLTGRDMVFPVNDILLNIENLKELFLPINKHGKNDKLGDLLDRVFDSDKMVLYFPAGLCSRKQKNGIIKDLEWKKTCLVKARKYDRDIIPVYINGKNSDFFYNMSNFRKKLGIKVNIEMLFLPKEMFKQRNKSISVTFGKPISIERFDGSKNDKQWMGLLRDYVYELDSDKGNNGFYE